MNSLEIDARDGRLWVRGPRDRRLAVFAAVLGAERVGDAWIFPMKHERAIREFGRKLAGVESAPARQPVVDVPAPIQESASHSTTVSLAEALAAMLDPLVSPREQLRHAAAAASMIDLDRVDGSTLEEAAAAFESLAGRLREIGSRRIVTANA